MKLQICFILSVSIHFLVHSFILYNNLSRFSLRDVIRKVGRGLVSNDSYLSTTPAHHTCLPNLPTTPVLQTCPPHLFSKSAHHICPPNLPTTPTHHTCPPHLPTTPAHHTTPALRTCQALKPMEGSHKLYKRQQGIYRSVSGWEITRDLINWRSLACLKLPCR